MARSCLEAIDTESREESARLQVGAAVDAAHASSTDGGKTVPTVGSAAKLEISAPSERRLPLEDGLALASSGLGTETGPKSPRSPRVARLLPLEVQLFFLALLPPQVRTESRYARRVSERVARLRRLIKQRRLNQEPDRPRSLHLDLGRDADQMQISVSLQRQSPHKKHSSVANIGSTVDPRTQLERLYTIETPTRPLSECPDPQHAALPESSSIWELGERALSFLLQSRRRRLLMYATLLVIILAPARVEGLARWAGELGIRPLAIRHPIFALLSVLLDVYQDLVGTSLIPDDAHWSLFAHVIEVLLLMVAM